MRKATAENEAMAELSPAASRSGLIGLAGIISVILYGFFESIADAPDSFQAALTGQRDELGPCLRSPPIRWPYECS